MVDDCRYIDRIEAKYSISELFVMHKYKKQGVGTHAVKYVLEKHKGKWQIGYNPENKIGKMFWNKVVNDFTKGKYELIRENIEIYDGDLGEVLIFET